MTTPTALSQLGIVLDELSIQWALIGALAANRYRSSPRMTNDIDLLLADTGPGLDQLEQSMVRAGWTVHRADPSGELLRLTHPEYGLADLLISGTDYQRNAIQRAITETIGNSNVNILTAEDVIIHKLIAGRFQDLADIEAIVTSMGNLDHEYIQKWTTFWEVDELWNQVNTKGSSHSD